MLNIYYQCNVTELLYWQNNAWQFQYLIFGFYFWFRLAGGNEDEEQEVRGFLVWIVNIKGGWC